MNLFLKSVHKNGEEVENKTLIELVHQVKVDNEKYGQEIDVLHHIFGISNHPKAIYYKSLASKG